MTIRTITGSFRRSAGIPRMASIELSDADTRTMQTVALEVFEDVVNAGATFQEALAAIYMTGFAHATKGRP